MIDYVKEKLGRCPRTAWLSESNTAFGAVKDGSLYVKFYFPIHISRVRAAFSSSRNAAKQQAPIFDLSRFKLNIPFDDTEDPKDIVPQFMRRT